MQAAIDAQSGMPLHGSAADGQQSSIGSDADISVISCDLNLNAAGRRTYMRFLGDKALS